MQRGPNEPKINVYKCQGCGKNTITVDVAHGVTPAMIRCKDGCREDTAHSMFYPPGGRLDQATWEWYRPDKEETRHLAPGSQRHVAHGGLLLRQRKHPEIQPLTFGEAKKCNQKGEKGVAWIEKVDERQFREATDAIMVEHLEEHKLYEQVQDKNGQAEIVAMLEDCGKQMFEKNRLGVMGMMLERILHLQAEAWTPEGEDQDNPHEWIRAGMCYASAAAGQLEEMARFEKQEELPFVEAPGWPFSDLAFQPADNAPQNLERAGAYLAVAIDIMNSQCRDEEGLSDG